MAPAAVLGSVRRALGGRTVLAAPVGERPPAPVHRGPAALPGRPEAVAGPPRASGRHLGVRYPGPRAELPASGGHRPRVRRRGPARPALP
ncbi:hypothetical protein [Streptomyces corynorhini]|uniref:Uncharacterized protein n=1 Tax=Streptomyces corynorhini TaxID=2282652 RepID=A0A370AYY5_9ACTN|nr:hypothetical protein [Streptomyces corynorhini]RDG32833.1 hypothetical protein DVH02_32025 [Streptomyces corynorhini]